MKGQRPLPRTPLVGRTDNGGELLVRSWYLFLVLESDRLAAGGARYSLGGVEEVLLGRRTSPGPEREAVKEAGGRLFVRVPGEATSREHTRLSWRDGAWYAEDLASTNGTHVSGARINTPTALRSGDTIQVGHAFFLIREIIESTEAAEARRGDLSGVEGFPGFPTLQPTFGADLAELRSAAATADTITIVGETGTGKEELAKALHALSGRRGPLVAVNSAGIETNLAESQLFGHVRGAYSGADRDHLGFLRAADGGTLLIDEILDLALPVQAKLLRAIEEQEVVPLGAARAIRIDVRIIAATQKRLGELVAAGKFRNDLMERLSRFTIVLPPLRERREDLGLLIATILHRAGRADNVVLPSRAVSKILAYGWPNNVRELKNVVHRAMVFESNGVLPSAKFPGPDDRGAQSSSATPTLSAADAQQREIMRVLLERHRGNVAAVAQELGTYRQDVHRQLRQLGLDWKIYRNSRDRPAGQKD